MAFPFVAGGQLLDVIFSPRGASRLRGGSRHVPCGRLIRGHIWTLFSFEL